MTRCGPGRAMGLVALCSAMGVQAAPDVHPEHLATFGSQGFTVGRFSSPTGAAFFDPGRVIIADRGNSVLQLCDFTGQCVRIGNDGFGFRNTPGTFDLPHGVAVNHEQRIAVADEDNHAVQLCTETNICLYSGDSQTMDNKPSPGLGKWSFPRDVAFGSANEVYGLDTGNHRIQVLRYSNLAVMRTHLLSEGQAPGQTRDPRGIAIDAMDRIIISDTGNHRIQVCTRAEIGNALECSIFGSMGNAVGQFNGPVGVEVDALGRIWVADTGNDRIQVCDDQGSCTAFGESGDGDGQFNSPTDVAVHPGGTVAVVDSSNHRIQILTIGALVAINAGMNDAWLNLETPGQGFFITVFLEQMKVFLAQFTFDTIRPGEDVLAQLGEPGHRWVTAFGDFNGAVAVLEAELTEGGVFDSAEPAVEQTQGYGTYTLEFSDCMNGTITYDFPGPGLQGVIPITRITPDNAALCEALNAP